MAGFRRPTGGHYGLLYRPRRRPRTFRRRWAWGWGALAVIAALGLSMGFLGGWRSRLPAEVLGFGLRWAGSPPSHPTDEPDGPRAGAGPAEGPVGQAPGPGSSGEPGGGTGSRPDDGAPADPPAQHPTRLIRATLASVGDVLLHNTLIEAGRNPGSNTYDFRPFFIPIRDAIGAADLAVANLEVPVAGADLGYGGYPRFNAPEAILAALKDAGFDVLTNANNHSLDRGARGLVRTYENLERYGFLHAGTARSAEERDRVTLAEARGIRVAFAAYTYGTNGIPLPQPYLVNLIDPRRIAADIARARAAGADLVAVALHFGNEYETEPTGAQERLVDAVLAAGADIVLGHHPHVLQRAELRWADGAGERQEACIPVNRQQAEAAILTGTAISRQPAAPGAQGAGLSTAGSTPPTVVKGPCLYKAVLYSQGNFLAGQIGEDRMTSALFWLEIAKDPERGRAGVTGIRYVPLYIHAGRLDGRRTWRPLPAREASLDPDGYHVPPGEVPVLQQAFRRAVQRLEAPGIRQAPLADLLGQQDWARPTPEAAVLLP